ncbi:hypothetical protein V1511DRAFT_503865 [Dipodascopsis uninucleata]
MMAEATNEKAANFRERLTPERKKLVQNFLLATTFSYLSVMIAKRSYLSRRYIPTLFQHNNSPPMFNRYRDAIQAVTISTLLSCSIFGMGVTGTCLVLDIHNPVEFNHYMKNVFGGAQRERERAKTIDPETKELEDSIEDMLSGISYGDDKR